MGADDGVRRSQPMWVQFVLFATFSLIVKYAEQFLFGTWEHPHFFHVFRGNTSYVLGWSLADGLSPDHPVRFAAAGASHSGADAAVRVSGPY